ncbi:ExeM/NucH family extracellular endonuclease [Deinococcus sp. RIT780]|uniref:ExeM/NucH family extracellular endonuclease n=1 Tax=Deinococcus sp. RIT780 TaxID=2870472 RepID=UPI00351D133D
MARTESRALLLAGLLALSGCATTGTPTTSPAPTPSTARVLGLYELNVNGLNGPSAQATVRPAGSLSAQATEVTGGLTFTRTNMSNVVDETNRVVHMTATFTVTNTTQTPITLPTYIPVDTDGTGGTSGATPFGEVRTRTGAPVSATGMQVEVAHHVSGGTIQADPNATPLRSGLDTGGLQVTTPAGQSVAGLSHQGWEGGALAPGTSQTITFAARVPLQGTQISDADPFAFKLVFAVADAPGQVALTNVASVQGTTPSGDAASPLSGQSVTVEGVVTSVHPSSDIDSLKGFFLQEEGIDADGDATTSDGVFVFCDTSCSTVKVGDRVRVGATVTEYRSTYTYPPSGNNPAVTVTAPLTTTRLTAPTVTTLSSGVPLPEAASIAPNLPVSQRERFEGMLVTTTGTVTSNFTLGRFGNVDLSASRITNYTQTNAPSVSGYSAYASDLPNQTLRIDNSSLQQNPDPIYGLNGQPLSAGNSLRGGDRGTATGVLHYEHDGFGNRSGSNFMYRVMTTSAQFDPVNPRQSAPEAVGNSNLRVGAMNVLNYFTTLVNSNTTLPSNTPCTPNGVGSAARGANNCEEFLRQQDKIVAAISGLNADVLNLMEIQNDFDKGSSSSVALLVQKLNATLGAGTYAYVNPGAKVGTDAISVAMIYKPAAVTPVGNLALLDNRFDPNYTDTCNRPSWAQTFQSNANGGRFTAVALHLKSKGGSCSGLGDADTGDGQGNGYKARENAANALVNWLATDPTGTGESDILLMGDYNAYAMEKPLSILATAGYTNLFSNSSYSYQFDGQWGSLDHATGSASLAAQVTGKTKWHINADEPTALDYNTEFKSAGQKASLYAADAFRSSDHDPLLIGLNLTAQTPLTPPAPTSSVSLSPATASVNVVAGQSTANTINVNRSNYTGSVNLATSVSGSGTAPTLTVTTQPGTGNSGALTIDATSATAGTYTVTVTGSGTGISNATTTFTVTVTTAPPVTGAGTPWINEFSYDSTAGSDLGDEYVEVIVPSGVDVNTLSLVLYNGSGGAVYRTDAFVNNVTANTTVTATPLTGGYTSYLFNFGGSGNNFQNGAPDGMALCSSTAGLIQFLSYEGTFTGVGGCAAGILSTDVIVSQATASTPGLSMQLTGSGNKYSDFTWVAPAANTKSAVNTGQTLN